MSNKALFTYTTKIEPSKTIAEIQEDLVAHGAKQVMANYTDNGKIEALSFVIVTPEGKAIAIRLPCDPAPVLKVLEKQYREGKVRRPLVNEEQALRVAWRIVKYWIEAQMALLETQMVKMEQIFLPYAIVAGGLTLFEAMRSKNFGLLEAKIETAQNPNAEEGEIQWRRFTQRSSLVQFVLNPLKNMQKPIEAELLKAG